MNIDWIETGRAALATFGGLCILAGFLRFTFFLCKLVDDE